MPHTIAMFSRNSDPGLTVKQQIERGLAHIESGRTIPHERAGDELRRKWALVAAG